MTSDQAYSHTPASGNQDARSPESFSVEGLEQHHHHHDSASAMPFELYDDARLASIAAAMDEVGADAPAELDNYANSCGSSRPGSNFASGWKPRRSAKKSADAARREKYIAMGLLWGTSSLQRVRKCRKTPYRTGGDVELRANGSTVGLGGLTTCGSVWACPLCSSKIQAKRRTEVRSILVQHLASGGTVAMITRTLRHKRSDGLAVLMSALRYSHDAVRQDKTVQRVRKELGFRGYIRALEVTHGSAGWHPHFHFLYLFNGQVSQADVDRLAAEEFRAWLAGATSKKVRDLGLKGVPTVEAQKAELCSNPGQALADYFAKAVYEGSTSAAAPSDSVAKTGKQVADLSYELTGAQTKEAAKGSRTPWQILYDITQTGDCDDIDLWLEYEAATKGKPAMTFAQGLKQQFNLDDLSDQEIAEETQDGGVVLSITSNGWAQCVRFPELIADLIAAYVRSGQRGAINFCVNKGIAYHLEHPELIGRAADSDDDDDGESPPN